MRGIPKVSRRAISHPPPCCFVVSSGGSQRLMQCVESPRHLFLCGVSAYETQSSLTGCLDAPIRIEPSGGNATQQSIRGTPAQVRGGLTGNRAPAQCTYHAQG